MAARGARARKVVEKETRKEEQKTGMKELRSSFDRSVLTGSRHGPGKHVPMVAPPGFLRPQTPQAQWDRHPSYSEGASTRYTASDTTGSLVSSVVDKITSKLSQPSGVSSASSGHWPTDGKDAKKFVARKGGRGTVAPRGRFGGVPMKVSEKNSTRDRKRYRPSHMFDTPPLSPSRSSTHSLRSSANAEKSWKQTKIWSGNGQPTRQYRGFENDEDLWMHDGNCLIFFSEETHEDDPKPMFRLHTKVLEQARSAFMLNLLKYGKLAPDKEKDDTLSERAERPTSPDSTTHWPLTPTNLEADHSTDPDHIRSDTSTTVTVTSDLRSQRSLRSNTWSPSGSDVDTVVDGLPGRQGGSIRIPPSIVEEDPALATSASEVGDTDNQEVEITHEIWFRAPSHIKRPEVQRRHHMATRNYLALLYGLPIVGNDFYEMLSDLHNIMETYYELNEASERWNAAQVIVQYLVSRKLDDVRNNLSAALGLLAWCEHPDIAWEAGYLEAFVHCVGMLSQAAVDSREYRNVSQVSRHKLQNAYNSVQLKLIEAEERLARFNFEEMWFVEGISSDHPAQRSFEAFRIFLYQFYASEYGQWPTPLDHHDRWLNRELVLRLQADFGNVYDYLVDRNIMWEAADERHSRKWEMINKRTGVPFNADWPGLPLSSMFLGFDSSLKYDHIPHPYPLLPSAKPPVPKAQEPAKSTNIFSKLKKSKDAPSLDAKTQYQIALAYSSASNINTHGAHFDDNKLLDEFDAFEKTSQIPGVSPQDARLGRWILLYGILQVLSSISVDTAGLKYTEGCKYFLNPSLNGCPPWKESPTSRVITQASQQRSYCWLAPKAWAEPGRPVPGRMGSASRLTPFARHQQQQQQTFQPRYQSAPYHAVTLDEDFDMRDPSGTGNGLDEAYVRQMESLLGRVASPTSLLKTDRDIQIRELPIRGSPKRSGPMAVPKMPSSPTIGPAVKDFAF